MLRTTPYYIWDNFSQILCVNNPNRTTAMKQTLRPIVLPKGSYLDSDINPEHLDINSGKDWVLPITELQPSVSTLAMYYSPQRKLSYPDPEMFPIPARRPSHLIFQPVFPTQVFLKESAGANASAHTPQVIKYSVHTYERSKNKLYTFVERTPITIETPTANAEHELLYTLLPGHELIGFSFTFIMDYTNIDNKTLPIGFRGLVAVSPDKPQALSEFDTDNPFETQP